MKPRLLSMALTILVALMIFCQGVFCQVSTDLKIDPLLFIYLKECRNITIQYPNKFFRGWDFQKTPVLFYRPGVQDILVGFPHQPKGFTIYRGFNPLSKEIVYYKNDSTLFDIDDQNTSSSIEGIPILVVADPFSSMRNQLRDQLSRPHEFVSQWLKDWNFIPSPYDKIETILHEAFHVYQNRMAPKKAANEMVVTQYPTLDPVNNSYRVLEAKILKDALLAQDKQLQLEKIKQFVAVRGFRQSRLEKSWAEYENLNEYKEGLAKYIQYKFMQLGENVKPIKEMYYSQGFNGYRGVLSRRFKNVLDNMVNIVSVNDNRFGNKFGAGPLRFGLYDLGACQGLLLDEVMPMWKEKIFSDTVYLCNLLKEAVPLTASERETYLNKAKDDYYYDDVYKEKLDFQKKGQDYTQQKLSDILESKQTVIKILYGDFTERIGLGRFTPFGVTQVSSRSAIYDLVPIKVIFKEGVTLDMKEVVPVFVDRDKKMVVFAIQTPVPNIESNSPNKLETSEFVLSGCNYILKKKDNIIEVQLK